MAARQPILFASLRDYRPAWLRADLLAGLTVWAVLVPESLAYATIAGVPPVVGLYAAVPSLVLYAVLGSLAAPGGGLDVGHRSPVGEHHRRLRRGGHRRLRPLTATLAIVTGVLGVLAGLLRLGFLASFISEPVLKGFIVGLALTIIVGQLPKLFGVPKGRGDFFEQMGGPDLAASATPAAPRWWWAWPASWSSWGCAAGCRWCPARWSRC